MPDEMEESTRSGDEQQKQQPARNADIDRPPDGRPDAIQALGAIVLSHEGGHVGRRLLQQRHGGPEQSHHRHRRAQSLG